MDRQPFPIPERIDEDAVQLARLVARYSYLPHPDVVAQFTTSIFPSIRGNARLGVRGTVIQVEGRDYVLDDNTTPRWALLVAHGFAPSIPTASRGWSLAHVWPESQCPESYTHLANLALVPEHFSSLTDKGCAVADYFRFHAFDRYGWKPPKRAAPPRPQHYDLIEWRYLDSVSNADNRIAAFLDASKNDWVLKKRAIRQQR